MFLILLFNFINHHPSLLHSIAPSMASTMLCTLRSLGGHRALVVPSRPSLIPLLGGNMRSFSTTTPRAEETQIPFSRYEELDNKWRKANEQLAETLDNKWHKDVNNLDNKWRMKMSSLLTSCVTKV
jgi:hypothetical protein